MTDKQLAFAGRAFLDEYMRTADTAEAMRIAARMIRAHAPDNRRLPRQPNQHTAVPVPDYMAEIVKRTAIAHGVTVGAIRGRRQDYLIVEVRDEAIWLLAQVVSRRDDDGVCRREREVIGAAVNRDQSSVLASLARFELRKAADDVLAKRMEPYRRQDSMQLRAVG